MYAKLIVNASKVAGLESAETFPIGSNVADSIMIGVEGSGANQPESGRRWEGKIATTEIYNRALSAAEVLENFNAIKSRFGK